MSERGYFAIGIVNTKTAANVGVLWRTADLFGASMLFTVGRRYKREPGDTMKSWKHIPLVNFVDVTDLVAHLPHECRLVGVEMVDEAVPLAEYQHWERAVYLLGAEDSGLPELALRRCHDLVRLPGRRSMNVAVAGSIVLYDRSTKPLVGSRARIAPSPQRLEDARRRLAVKDAVLASTTGRAHELHARAFRLEEQLLAEYGG